MQVQKDILEDLPEVRQGHQDGEEFSNRIVDHPTQVRTTEVLIIFVYVITFFSL